MPRPRPDVIITGAVDKTMSANRHSRPFAEAVADAKLVVLPEVCHMLQNAAPDLVITEIEALIRKLSHGAAAVAN